MSCLVPPSAEPRRQASHRPIQTKYADSTILKVVQGPLKPEKEIVHNCRRPVTKMTHGTYAFVYKKFLRNRGEQRKLQLDLPWTLWRTTCGFQAEQSRDSCEVLQWCAAGRLTQYCSDDEMARRPTDLCHYNQQRHNVVAYSKVQSPTSAGKLKRGLGVASGGQRVGAIALGDNSPSQDAQIIHFNQKIAPNFFFFCPERCLGGLQQPFSRGVARNLFWGYNFLAGGIKLQYSCSIVVLALFLPNKKFTWTDFGGYIYPYTPVATPLPFRGQECQNLYPPPKKTAPPRRFPGYA